MKRLENLFASKKANLLNIYCTAGYPHFDSTLEILKSLQEHGADIIELGMPYSDPLADGPVIQASSAVALKNGMTISKLFEQIRKLREEINLPVILMGYLNPVLQYGFDRFCADAERVGIDGIILPDLPVHEFEKQYAAILEKHNLDFMFLVTPETPGERILHLDNLSSGFLYAVSSSSTTGSDKNEAEISQYLAKLRKLGLKNPVLAGFGIKDKKGFEAVCQHARGGIIGSAYIKALENSMDVNATTKSFLTSIIA